MLLAWHIKEHLLTTQKNPPTSHTAAPPQPLMRMWGSSLPRWFPALLCPRWHTRASAALSSRRGSSAWNSLPQTPLSMCPVLSCFLGNTWLGHSPRAKIRMTKSSSPTELKGEQFGFLAPSSQPNSGTGTGLSFRSSHSQSMVSLSACAPTGQGCCLVPHCRRMVKHNLNAVMIHLISTDLWGTIDQ